MSSCILFHGPGSRQASLDEAHRIGRLVAPPFGDEGLKVEDARQVVEILQSPPVGVQVGVVVVGPMDLANEQASDVLLKSIEEFSEVVQPLLWAHDLGDVSETIQSRCLARWSPILEEAVDESLEEAARELVQATKERALWRVCQIIHSYKGRERDLIGAAAGHLLVESDPWCFRLWDRVRASTQHRNVTMTEITAAFLPED